MITTTCKEALELARAALEDDARMTPGPWHHDDDVMWACVTTAPRGAGVVVTTAPETCSVPMAKTDAAGIAAARTREPALARFVLAMFASEVDAASKLEAVLSAKVDGLHVESARVRVTNGIPDLCIDFYSLTQSVTLYSWQNVRALAAILLRAADGWEAAHRRDPDA